MRGASGIAFLRPIQMGLSRTPAFSASLKAARIESHQNAPPQPKTNYLLENARRCAILELTAAFVPSWGVTAAEGYEIRLQDLPPQLSVRGRRRFATHN